jgi:hypothetical protein
MVIGVYVGMQEPLVQQVNGSQIQPIALVMIADGKRQMQ